MLVEYFNSIVEKLLRTDYELFRSGRTLKEIGTMKHKEHMFFGQLHGFFEAEREVSDRLALIGGSHPSEKSVDKLNELQQNIHNNHHRRLATKY